MNRNLSRYLSIYQSIWDQPKSKENNKYSSVYLFMNSNIIIFANLKQNKYWLKVTYIMIMLPIRRRDNELLQALASMSMRTKLNVCVTTKRATLPH